MTHDASPPAIPGLEIIDVIAHGGQATLYRARQPGHDRTVAVKVPHDRLADEVAVRRFDRERTALGRLSAHPDIVALLDSGYTEDDCPYMVLEYAPGGTLADRLDSGPMSVDEATDLAIRLAGALECAHRAGVLHRDLKPHNVVRSRYGQWQLTDFGIAAVTGTGPATETVQLSFAHAAPESFDAGASTAQSDVYSLASTIYTALTGEEPFAKTDGEVAASTLRRAMFDPAPDLTLRGVPEPLARLLQDSLCKDPQERPVTAEAFGRAINEQRSELGLPLIPLVVGTPSSVADAARGRSTARARPTRKVDVSGAFHKVGPDGASEPESTASRTWRRRRHHLRRRLQRRHHRSAGGVRRRIALLASFAFVSMALVVAIGLVDRDIGFIEDIVDTVSVVPAAAADDDANDGVGGDGADGNRPNRGGPRDGNGPEGRRSTTGP